MAFIADEFHKKQLDKHKINIKTTYISADKILERNTDGKKNDDVKNGIRARKDIEEYFGKQVYLDLFVKVIPKWRDKEKFLNMIGYKDFLNK